jgi:hypothetical protein
MKRFRSEGEGGRLNCFPFLDISLLFNFLPIRFQNISRLFVLQTSVTKIRFFNLYFCTVGMILIFLFISVQLSYWEVFNAEEIRQLVLGRHSSLTALSISRNGEHFITATQDSLVKVTTNSIEFVLDVFELLAKESASLVKGGGGIL